VVSSQHAERALTVRPPVELRNAAQRVLTERDREMQAFVVACLAALTADPDPFLAQLAVYWPPPKPRGRPRRPTGASATASTADASTADASTADAELET
jgi:hypothetical protein